MEEKEIFIKTIKQFNNWAIKYDHGIWRMYFNGSNKRALSFIDHKQEIKIIDIGCGTGKFIELVNNHLEKSEIVGLDIACNMISVAKSRKYKNNNNCINFIESNSDNIPFNTSYFDYVFCLNSFHHYPNKSKVLNEIYRITKRGGRVILLDPFTNNIIRNIWTVILKKLFKEDHVEYHTKEEIIKLFSHSGLTVVKQKTLFLFTLFTIAVKG